jgi:phosphoglycerol transferase MdoB-like AlkP superfamily enzyme
MSFGMLKCVNASSAPVFLFKNAYSRMLLIFLACMVPFTLMRLVLYLVYHEDFRSLGVMEVFEAFAIGLRFDASMVAMVIGLPLLMLMLPFRWSHHVYWQRLWGWFIFIALLLMIFMMAADTIYFGDVHRHVGAEIGVISADMASMVMLALSQYGGALFLFGLIAVAGAIFWRYLTHPIPTAPRRIWLRLASIVAGLLLLVILGRGGIVGKPISVGEAFFSNSLAQGYLALNGAFAIARALDDRAQPPKVFMPQTVAIERTHDYLFGKGTPFYDRKFPLYQQAGAGTQPRHPDQQSPAQTPKPNVVVLMLESWGAIHIDALRKQMNLPPLGVTPNFDSLAQHGRLYTQFYANGQRSIQGAAAIFAGLPTLPGMPFLGAGLEQNQQRYLGELALSQGYETIFLQSSDRGSLRFDAIAARAGFSTYLGNEDIPELHQTKKTASTWGTWDHNTFQEANKRFAAAHKPFLGYLFTSTTHVPWLIPDNRWKKYTGGSDLDKSLNALYYADWALGEFIAAAKRAGYYDNTIFVLTADHTNEFVENVEYVPNLFHIPLLIVGPGIKSGIDDRVGSQFDIPPTIMDIAGWSADHAGLGRSLMDNTRINERAAFTVRDNVINWITANGWISHNLTRRVGASKGLAAKDLDEMEQNLLAVYQATSRLQLDNQIAPPNQSIMGKK